MNSYKKKEDVNKMLRISHSPKYIKMTDKDRKNYSERVERDPSSQIRYYALEWNDRSVYTAHEFRSVVEYFHLGLHANFFQALDRTVKYEPLILFHAQLSTSLSLAFSAPRVASAGSSVFANRGTLTSRHC